MKRTFLLFFFLFWVLGVSAQNFFDTHFDQGKRYILLCDPTIHRIETVKYLTQHKIFKVDTKNVEFVGVYFDDQNYDFSKTKQFIDENKLSNYHLQKISGDLDETNLFKRNSITDQLRKVFENSIGVIFFGGPDIPPGVYGEENTKSFVTDPQRHYYEASFMFHLLGGYQDETFQPFLEEKPDYVVTGFCLGMQTMNVGTGGTLVQDIPQEIYGADNAEETVKIDRNNMHRNYWQEVVEDTLLMGINLHPIQFTSNSFFGKEVKVNKADTPRIYSAHHQAVEKIGKGLEVTALSSDGKIIEGLVHSKYINVFAVQFHPEVSALYEDMFVRKFAPDDQPLSYYQILGKKGVRFNKAYWKQISDAFKSVSN
ncbi:MAG TPA: gamma-glutamyl-gamma-aminobutyrate hydrolase family protein [Draconibacterium sp.]|nr:gamma-glutamyl-gamma-aminobutyrate hydrolase family protein [Draconibacterium sp.]